MAESDSTSKSASSSRTSAAADAVADDQRFPEDAYGDPLFETKPFEESPWNSGDFVGVDPMYQGPSDVRSADADKKDLKAAQEERKEAQQIDEPDKSQK